MKSPSVYVGECTNTIHAGMESPTSKRERDAYRASGKFALLKSVTIKRSCDVRHRVDGNSSGSSSTQQRLQLIDVRIGDRHYGRRRREEGGFETYRKWTDSTRTILYAARGKNESVNPVRGCVPRPPPARVECKVVFFSGVVGNSSSSSGKERENIRSPNSRESGDDDDAGKSIRASSVFFFFCLDLTIVSFDSQRHQQPMRPSFLDGK